MKHVVARLLSPRTWRETAHLLLDLAVGVALFTWVVTMLSLGAGLAITVIGIPLLALAVVSGRWIGVMERGRTRLLLGDDVPEPVPFAPAPGLWPRIRAGLGDRAGWKGLAYGLVMLPWGIVTFTVAVVVWSVALGLTTLPLFDWALPDGGFEWGSYRLTGLGLVGAYVLTFLGGIGCLALAPTVVHAMAEGDRRLVRLLLSRGPNEVLEHRVTQLQESRDASVESAASELRRIERDLHDGAQQRLVSLAMNLGSRVGRPRPRRCQAGDRRTARPRPRHPSGGPHRPRARRRGVGARRSVSRAGRARHRRPRPPVGADRGRRLLRGRRVAHQRREAQRCPPGDRAPAPP
jgi:Putative sensor/Histidine kinase